MLTRKAYVEFVVEKREPEPILLNLNQIIKKEAEIIKDGKRLEEIDIKFSVRRYRGQQTAEAYIDICNLARQDMEYLTSYMGYAGEKSKRKRIILYAGYEETGVNFLFDGDIIEALPTSPPDIWLRCKAIVSFYDNQSTINVAYENITIQDLGLKIANILNLKLDFRIETNKTIKAFNYDGGKTNILNELNAIDEKIVGYEEFGKLIIDDKDKKLKTKNVMKVSKDTGMIGMPEIGPQKIIVKTFLNNNFKLGNELLLESMMIPSANGTYYSYYLEHNGHLRGNEWYTTLYCHRFKT
ncbi:MAG: hypothetical protein LBF97_01190 [Elusimicrobiota bacterium]|jgi:hypothetical protein|nr:hypothetical protein [Elusimicrobiota bacterium]